MRQEMKKMNIYIRMAQKLIKEFRSAHIERFSRTNNSHAGALTTLVFAVDSKLKRTIEVEYLPKPSIETGGKFEILKLISV